MIKTYNNIFDYIVTQKVNFKQPIAVNKKWNWSFKDHVELTELYTNSQSLNKTDWTPIKNITKPILNLEHRTEDIELKDVQIYVDDPDKYHLSFLVKKYHDDVFVQENDLDTFFDELNVSRIDFGGGLSKEVADGREVVPLQTIEFCDQREMIGRPIGIRHGYSADELLEMGKVGWGKTENGATISLKDLITLSMEQPKEKDEVVSEGDIEVFEVHGNLPKKFADSSDTSGEYETRIFICAFYQKQNSSDKQGVILYTAKETESPFMLIKRDPIYGRALGFGGAEELFEAQVWVNYDMIRIQDMLDAASKTILKATGANSSIIAKKQKVKDLDNLTIIDAGDGDLNQVDTFPRNMQLFDKSVAEWENHAQQMGAANDSIMGQPPTAGTPFKLQELVTNESHGLHDYRRGQYAKHIEEIYKKTYIPKIIKKICEGATFLSELSLDELQYVTENLATNESNKRIKEIILSGGTVTPEQQKMMTDLIKEGFKKGGNKKFVQILKGEFKNTPLAVKATVKGKSKDLAGRTDKLVNIMRQIISNPAALQIPVMAGIFNQIIEASGLDPVDFSSITKEQIQAAQPQPAQGVVPSPIQQPQLPQPTNGQ